jgi:glycosyltransferase involved in cell wall biosynthesis
MKSNNIGVLILTKNEEIHLQRCINSIKNISSNIYIVDSYSKDKTLVIAKKNRAKIFKKRFFYQAETKIWALKNIKFEEKYILLIDADEYLDKKTQIFIKKNFNKIKNYNGIYIKRNLIYKNRNIRFGGTFPQKQLRLWKNGHARCEDKIMDESIIVDQKLKFMPQIQIYDHSLKKNNFFFEKHLQYAKREAVHQIFFIENNANTTRSHLKFYFYKYFQLYFIRVVILFFFKNILLLGILDGLKGIEYSFKRDLIYRLMVDFFICKFKLINLKKLTKKKLIEKII